MARDCPDRQRGQNWREDRGGFAGRPGQPRIAGGDAVDREYESLMNELSGGAVGGSAPQRIEAGPGGYDDRQDNGAPDRDVKPWQRGPTGGPAPWQQRNRDDRDGGNAPPPWASGGRNDSYGGHGQGGYGGGSGGAAPWQQSQAPPPPPGGQSYGYGGYGNYGDPNAGYGAPPGLAGAPPPGLGALLQNYGAAGSPPPPPPGGAPPPPPPGDAPPPPVSPLGYHEVSNGN